MKKGRNLFQKNGAPAIENNVATLASEVTLKCGKRNVTGISCVPPHDLIAVVARKRVYIYKYSTQGQPIRYFDEHKENVHGLVHLSADVLASVDVDGMLLTWRATTGDVIDKLKVSGRACLAIARARGSEIPVRTENGDIIIATHSNGKNLAVKKRCKSVSNEKNYEICGYNDIFAAVQGSNVVIRNSGNGHLLHTIEDKKRYFCCVAVSEKLLQNLCT